MTCSYPVFIIQFNLDAAISQVFPDLYDLSLSDEVNDQVLSLLITHIRGESVLNA